MCFHPYWKELANDYIKCDAPLGLSNDIGGK